MSKAHSRSHYYKAYLSIAHARNHILAGNHSEAEKHVQQAHVHAGEHLKELTVNHKHDEAKAYTDEIKPFFDRVDHLLTQSKAKVAKSMPSDPAERAAALRDKASQIRNEIRSKISSTPLPATAGAMRPQQAYGVGRGVQFEPEKGAKKITGTKIPGHDSRYQYKAFHQLSTESQAAASHAFQGKDMHVYHYPTDQKTGEFVHSTRAKMPAGPQWPTSQDHGVVVKPEHMAGNYVRINNPESPLHGKLGIVKAPNPSIPGKIPVQVGHAASAVVHVEPHHVRLSKGDETINELAQLRERAASALYDIKGRIKKS